ncbi:hypothetical protein D018_0669A, partial [Vibrio parahaemolyticus VP2007-007]
MGGFLSIQSLS